MADYYKIQSLSNKGDISISRKVFEQIASDATSRVNGASVSKKEKFRLSHPVSVTFHGNGQVEISISISLSKDANVSETCKKIQEEVASSLMAYSESIPYDIKIKVASIA